MSIKLIAIDVDGTLVSGFTTPVSTRNREAIIKAMDRGMYVCLLSGRVYPSLKSRAVEVKANGPLAACNGSHIRWKGKELYSRHIHQDALLRCGRIIQDAGIYFHVWTKDGGYCISQNYDCKRYENMNTAIPEESRVKMHVYDDASQLAERVGKKALKMTILEPDMERLAALRPLLEKAAGPEAIVTKSEAYNLEVIDRQVSKGAALTIMARACGVQFSDILAIGNSYNDIPMFELAGVSVAVGGSDDEVLHSARYVVSPWDRDGVAEAIEKYAL